MRVQTYIISFFLLYLFSYNEVRAQEQYANQKSLIKDLIKEGFENVGIQQDKENVYLFYENRVYRWEIDGLARILKEAVTTFNDSTILHIVPLRYQVPVAIITTRIKSYKETMVHQQGNSFKDIAIKVSMNADSLNPIRKKIKLQNSPYGKIDLIFLPGFRFQFGNFSNPFEKRVSISPIIQTSLWKGMLLSAEVLIPLFNDLQQNYESKIRLETATVNQLFRLPKDLFIYSSAGIFPYINRINSRANFQRYGVTTDIRKYFLNGRIGTGVNLGITGIMNFSEGYLNYWPFNKINFALYGEYREPKFDFTTRLTVGKFLYEDYAVRLDLSRQFHEINMGVYVIKSNMNSIVKGETGTVGGISIAIPIAPRKSFKPAPFRINLARLFNLEWRDRSVNPLATTYKTNNDWAETARNLNPDFTEKQLQTP